MMWFAKQKPLVAVASVLILATAGVAVQGRQQTAPEGAGEPAKPATTLPQTAVAGAVVAPNLAANQAIAKEQLVLIDKALGTLHELARNGRIRLSASSLSQWEYRRLETLRRTGIGKAEMVAAIEKYVEILKHGEAIAKAQMADAQGTAVDFFDAQYRRMEAEIFLNEEKAR